MQCYFLLCHTACILGWWLLIRVGEMTVVNRIPSLLAQVQRTRSGRSDRCLAMLSCWWFKHIFRLLNICGMMGQNEWTPQTRWDDSIIYNSTNCGFSLPKQSKDTMTWFWCILLVGAISFALGKIRWLSPRFKGLNPGRAFMKATNKGYPSLQGCNSPNREPLNHPWESFIVVNKQIWGVPLF